MLQQKIMHNTGFSQGILPFKYLGVPLAIRKIIVHYCRPMINRIVGKITHWTSKLLSYAGQLQLIKSIMFVVTSY